MDYEPEIREGIIIMPTHQADAVLERFVDDEISIRCSRYTWRHLAFRKYDLIYSGRDGELDTIFATVEGMEADIQAICDALNETNHVPVVCR